MSETERAIEIIEARLPLYTDIGQINALRECISSIRSSYRSAEAGKPVVKVSVPDGWQLVPKKPDEEMIAAAFDAHEPLDGNDEDFRAEFKRTYRAMLTAAPQPNPSTVDAPAFPEFVVALREKYIPAIIAGDVPDMALAISSYMKMDGFKVVRAPLAAQGERQ